MRQRLTYEGLTVFKFCRNTQQMMITAGKIFSSRTRMGNMPENWYRLDSDDWRSVVEYLKLWGRFRMSNLLGRVKQLYNYQELNLSQVPFCNRDASSIDSLCKHPRVSASSNWYMCQYDFSSYDIYMKFLKYMPEFVLFTTSETRKTLYGPKKLKCHPAERQLSLEDQR